MNGLGWYHGIIRKDHETAVKYFEQAALNGSSDGMFNLGIYHLNGKNPSSPFINEVCLPHMLIHIQSGAISEPIYFLYDPQTAAFQRFLKASQHGHVAASVEVAWYLSTGNLEGVSQDVERAVM